MLFTTHRSCICSKVLDYRVAYWGERSIPPPPKKIAFLITVLTSPYGNLGKENLQIQPP